MTTLEHGQTVTVKVYTEDERGDQNHFFASISNADGQLIFSVKKEDDSKVNVELFSDWIGNLSDSAETFTKQGGITALVLTPTNKETNDATL